MQVQPVTRRLACEWKRNARRIGREGGLRCVGWTGYTIVYSIAGHRVYIYTINLQITTQQGYDDSED